MKSVFPELSPLDREYLPIRAKILEVASALDRIQRTSGHEVDDPRWQQLQSAINLLFQSDPVRAEEVQMLFSRTYDENWRTTFDV